MAAPAAKSINDASTLGPMLAAPGLPLATFTRRMFALSWARHTAGPLANRAAAHAPHSLGKKREARACSGALAFPPRCQKLRLHATGIGAGTCLLRLRLELSPALAARAAPPPDAASGVACCGKSWCCRPPKRPSSGASAAAAPLALAPWPTSSSASRPRFFCIPRGDARVVLRRSFRSNK